MWPDRAGRRRPGLPPPRKPPGPRRPRGLGATRPRRAARGRLCVRIWVNETATVLLSRPSSLFRFPPTPPPPRSPPGSREAAAEASSLKSRRGPRHPYPASGSAGPRHPPQAGARPWGPQRGGAAGRGVGGPGRAGRQGLSGSGGGVGGAAPGLRPGQKKPAEQEAGTALLGARGRRLGDGIDRTRPERQAARAHGLRVTSASGLSGPRLPGLSNGNGVCARHLQGWAERPSASAGQTQLHRSGLLPPLKTEFPCGSAGKESACNAGDLGSILGWRKFSWRWERLPTPWPGEFHGLYSPWGRKESDTIERLSLSLPIKTEVGRGPEGWMASPTQCV